MNRVCYVIPSLDVGGTERQLLYLMEGLAGEWELTVICTRSEGRLALEARRLGAQVHTLDGGGGWDLTLRRRIQQLFRAHRPDVVHTFLSGFDYAAAAAARRTGVPVVIGSRRELAAWMQPRHVRLQRKANALVDCVVANCKAAAEFAIAQEHAPPDLFRTIYNGVNADAFVSQADPDETRLRFGIRRGVHVIGKVANFSPIKDHPLFLDIARELMLRRSDVHFLLAGSGPELKEILKTVRQRKWDEHFTHHTASHATNDMADLYSMMSVAVLCSKSEGFPNAVMEAMAARRPVVAARVGGVPELVENGRTGYIIESRKPADYADAIERVLAHPDESRIMGQRAHEWVTREFSVERMVTAHRSLYAELLARSTVRHH